jgi:hypothetical protein
MSIQFADWRLFAAVQGANVKVPLVRQGQLFVELARVLGLTCHGALSLSLDAGLVRGGSVRARRE